LVELSGLWTYKHLCLKNKNNKKLDFVTDFRKHDDFVTLKMERGDLRIPAIMEVAKLAGIEIKSVNLRKPSLEDVFLRFTGRRIRE